MTNQSFLFSCDGEEYILRIPGVGTSMLIDRKREAAVYNDSQNIKYPDFIEMHASVMPGMITI